MNAGFKSARSAALKFKWSPSTYAAHENGQNSYNGDQAVVYARAFKVQPEWLYIGLGDDSRQYSHVFDVKGYIGDRGVTAISQSESDEVVQIALAFAKAHENTVMFQVITDTLYPAYKSGQLLMTMRTDLDLFASDYLQDAIVTFDDQSAAFGTLVGGQENGHYDLLRFGSPPLRKIAIVDTWVVVSRIDRLGWQRTGDGSPSLMSDDELFEKRPGIIQRRRRT